MKKIMKKCSVITLLMLLISGCSVSGTNDTSVKKNNNIDTSTSSDTIDTPSEVTLTVNYYQSYGGQVNASYFDCPFYIEEFKVPYGSTISNELSNRINKNVQDYYYDYKPFSVVTDYGYYSLDNSFTNLLDNTYEFKEDTTIYYNSYFMVPLWGLKHESPCINNYFYCFNSYTTGSVEDYSTLPINDKLKAYIGDRYVIGNMFHLHFLEDDEVENEKLPKKTLDCFLDNYIIAAYREYYDIKDQIIKDIQYFSLDESSKNETNEMSYKDEFLLFYYSDLITIQMEC